jgi:lipid-binding SYLF domain-containing protein
MTTQLKINHGLIIRWREFFGLMSAVLLLAAPGLRADTSGNSSVDDAKASLAKQITTAWVFYQTLQIKPETSIPSLVVAKAKGVMILNQWSGGVVIGGSGGNGIGMKKNASGEFSAPAFYNMGGGSFGIQIGGSNTQIVAFLMTDKGLTGLTDNKMVWGGTAKAVAGPSAASTQTIDDSADVIIYQKTSGLDVGAAFSGVKITNNNEGNRLFYNNPALTPTDIFSGNVTTPDAAKPLIEALNKQASQGN